MTCCLSLCVHYFCSSVVFRCSPFVPHAVAPIRLLFVVERRLHCSTLQINSIIWQSIMMQNARCLSASSSTLHLKLCFHPQGLIPSDLMLIYTASALVLPALLPSRPEISSNIY